MRYYCYYAPVWGDNNTITGSEIVTVSEEDIRRTYFPVWYDAAVQQHGHAYVQTTLSFEECLEDWIAVNQAWKSN